MIRSSPSTARHSFVSARMLSFVRAPATVDWRRLFGPPELIADRRDVEARVPDVDVPHLGEARHRFAVFAHRRVHGCSAGRVGEAAIPSGNGETGGEPFHVPLERSRQRLVEVVETEDEPPVGCGEDAEVREVRIAAELGVDPGPRPVREVRRHQVGGPAEEGERRLQHAPIPDRTELRKARLRLTLQQIDRISTHRRRLPTGVRGTRQLGTGSLSAGGAFTGGGVRHRLRRLRRFRRRIRSLLPDLHLAHRRNLLRSRRIYFVLTG